jgi:CelD/BcsL family acetyltransferase involved in cellulose biosynthesis
VNVTAYEHADLFEALRPEWNELVRRSLADCIFNTWEWQSVWWEVYQPGRLWVLTCRDDSGRLLGLASWFIAQQADGTRVVRAIGCREVTDYIDIIVDRDQPEAIAEALIAYAAAHADQFDAIELCNLPEQSISYRLLPGLLAQHGFTASTTHEDVCPIIELPDTWDGYLALLDKKQRHEIRRKLRRAQGTGEAVDWYIVGREHKLEVEINTFLALMAASDDDKARFLTDGSNTAFFRALIPALSEAGWLQLAFLTVEGQPAAAYLNFDYAGHILVYNSGLLQTAYGHLSPGIVLLAYLIQHAIETGHHVFDFLQGDEVYKYRMGGQDTHVYNLTAQRAP